MKKAVLIAILCVVCVAVVASFFIASHPGQEGGLRIGIILPLSGGAANLGQACRNGYELAREDLQPAGSDRASVKLQLFYEDSQNEGKFALSAAEKLIQFEKVHALMCLTTTETQTLAPIARREKLVLLTGTLAPGIADAQNYVFRNAPGLDQQALSTLSYAIHEMSLKRIALLYLQIDAHISVVKFIRQELPKAGGQLVAEEKGQKDSTDFKTQVTNVLRNKPEAIYVMGYDETGYMMRQARELGYTGPFFADPAVGSPSVLNIAGTAAEGVIYGSADITGENAPPYARSFVERYEQRYGKAPDVFAADSYDSLFLIALAAARLKESGGDWRKSLLAIREYQGVTGIFSFLPSGDVEKPVILRTIRNGKSVILESPGEVRRDGGK